MKLVREKPVEEIAKWRDEKLVGLLKILYGELTGRRVEASSSPRRTPSSCLCPSSP